MPQIRVCLQLFTKLISVDTKLLHRCCDRMRYVLKHNDNKFFFLCCYAYALTVAVTLIFQVIYTWHKDAYVYILMLLCPWSKPSCNARVHYIIFSSLIKRPSYRNPINPTLELSSYLLILRKLFDLGACGKDFHRPRPLQTICPQWSLWQRLSVSLRPHSPRYMSSLRRVDGSSTWDRRGNPEDVF